MKSSSPSGGSLRCKAESIMTDTGLSPQMTGPIVLVVCSLHLCKQGVKSMTTQAAVT